MEAEIARAEHLLAEVSLYARAHAFKEALRDRRGLYVTLFIRNELQGLFV
jgi:hypothetical protein